MATAIWFKQDLRITDNPAVADALQRANADEAVFGIFVATPATWHVHDWAPIKADFLWRHLQAFNEELAQQGIQLQVINAQRFSEVPGVLARFCQQHEINYLAYNHEYPVHEANRDRAVQAWLQQHQVVCQGWHGALLVPPQAVRTQQGSYYQKFTPFNRAWRKHLASHADWQPVSLPQRKALSPVALPDCPYPRRDSSAWPVSEKSAKQRLTRYINELIDDYKRDRDYPARDNTSRLSPYWELGLLSPRTAARRLLEHSPQFPEGLKVGADTWLTELAWREFYQHLMQHEPRLSKGQSFIRYADDMQWRQSDEDFRRWCEGRTGVPIVDAGIRQLLQEGWMHNRVRMIVANFLVKDLMLDWRLGERFFMQQLIDGSFPANNGGWQWSASVGTDAVPYFRVFNPFKQSEKFDPDGVYIRNWVKELETVPTAHIHQPRGWLEKHGRDDYPAPMVDHAAARETFINSFKRVKNG
ncbi:deoxyribodipyrimidine photo-lyase [Idiomarina xiamenensis]|uniref:Deoxyribodipyrimidine photo-lyase n=1 Tax=Idiomarina xiamenensis 10-D-4 TaxID=740709 RepID=K2LAP9_9GAMM|nr:deoxyribodipyrimidine photo-lyase [Idiomarina xiamenensis]EKE86900.1 deoxyribodipyrimidine photolyase [Idiomarina xiamenensis 10-D-4]